MAKQKDNVVREYANIGKYRVRLLATDNGHQVLDIREYIQDQSFQGFTRRGIRLVLPTDTASLAATLAELLPTPEPSPTGKTARKKR
jgi:hypothetical protein